MNNADLRYHIASLSAVFLALGIGILIGTVFVGTPIVSRQTGLIRRLETHVNTMRDEEMRERERTEDALRRLLPHLLDGTLAGKRVLVVQTGGYADATTAVVETLKMAGATPLVVILPPDGWRSLLNRPDSTPETVVDQARRLAPRLATGSTDLWQSYRESGLLADAPAPPLAPGATRFVVLVGGESTAGGDTSLLDRRDVPLIDTWQSAGLTVVGVEPMKTELSYLPTYRNAGIATIDSIDRAAGRLALPYALKGERAAYGYRSDAERVLPPSLELAPTPSPSPSPTPAVKPVIKPMTAPKPEAMP